MASFERERDFSAWLGLVPRQHWSGGKPRLGRTSKMGQRNIRRLLITGAMSVVTWKGCGGGAPGSWLARMLARKPHARRDSASQQDGTSDLGDDRA